VIKVATPNDIITPIVKSAMRGKSIRANGKLLLTGEYVVMDGVSALALPVRYGQTLSYSSDFESVLISWKSIDSLGKVWFSAQFEKLSLEIVSASDWSIGAVLQRILLFVKAHNASFINELGEVEIVADFPLNWGLGSSSTLIYTLGKASNIDPYLLQYQFFGGSGYDIACAESQFPLVFKKNSEQERSVVYVDFYPGEPRAWAFVYLGKKQNSRDAIKEYRNKVGDWKEVFNEITSITMDLALNVLEHSAVIDALNRHEQLISKIIDIPTIQSTRFSDFKGVVKSLGAWGGDFVLAISQESEIDPTYFHQKKYEHVIPYQAMIL